MHLTKKKSKNLNIVAISLYDLGHQPLPLAAAAAIFKKHSCDFSLIDLSISNLNEDEITAADIILISVPMHTAARMALNILPTLKELNPDAHISAFGLYAIQLEDSLSENYLDSAFAGEFEPNLELLLQEYVKGNNSHVSSKTWEKLRTDFARQKFFVPERKKLPNLNEYAKIQYRDNEKINGYIETSRGCAHICSHCPVTAVYQGKFRIIDQASILSDVDNLINQGAEHITFGDPDFFNAPKHSLKIASMIKTKYPFLTFDATIKVEHILEYEELIQTLDDLGFLYIISAFESTSDNVLKHLKKNHNLYDMYHVLEICKNANLFIKPTWIPFTPWMKYADYVRMLNFIIENDLVGLTPRIQYGIKLLIPKYSALFDSDSLSEFDMQYSSDLLNHEWSHKNSEVEMLFAEVSQLLQSSNEDAMSQVNFFQKLCNLVAARTDESIINCQSFTGPSIGSTENWYCCAEPTNQQLISVNLSK
tara:strand:- start:2289 stop:3725 length:1437 start_codon:yes stop_codon:yes gene_type:complete